MVDNLDNGGKSTGKGVVAVDENNAADLNEAPVGTLDHCFAHDDCGLGKLWLVQGALNVTETIAEVDGDE